VEDQTATLTLKAWQLGQKLLLFCSEWLKDKNRETIYEMKKSIILGKISLINERDFLVFPTVPARQLLISLIARYEPKKAVSSTNFSFL